MKNIKNIVQFLIFLLKRGRLKRQGVDFQAIKSGILKNLPEEVQSILPQKVEIRKEDLSFLAYLKGNIAFIKNRTRPQCFLSEKQKLAYIRIPKAGSTSILYQLLLKENPEINGIQLSNDQIDAISEQFLVPINKIPEGYKVFTVVRNPFERLVSAYLDLFKNPNRFILEDYLFGVFRKEMAFKEFVTFIQKIPDRLKDQHFKPQTHLIFNLSLTNTISWFKLEDEEKLSEFLKKYGMALNYLNKAGPYQYQNFYDKETWNLTEEIYKDDLTKFNYDQQSGVQLHF